MGLVLFCCWWVLICWSRRKRNCPKHVEFHANLVGFIIKELGDIFESNHIVAEYELCLTL